MSRRTIIVSDLHGFAALLENALKHASFGPGDRLVVAGDLVDIGPDDCIGLAESLGATILAGNHEVSAALDLAITPQNPDTPQRGPEFARRFLAGDWPLAAAVEGWLVTHGGLSTLFTRQIRAAEGDTGRLADDLNAAFRAEVRRFVDGELTEWDLGRSPIVGSELGPLWFRAGQPELVPSGLRQIAGHTPCEFFSAASFAALTAKDFLLTDPGAHLEPDPRRRTRYAVVENGEAWVVNACR